MSTELENKLLPRIINQLKSFGVSYHIVGSNGTVYTSESRRKRAPISNRGITDYVRPFVENATLDEVVIVPITEEYDCRAIASACSGVAYQKFGAGSSICIQRKDRKAAEFLLLSTNEENEDADSSQS